MPGSSDLDFPVGGMCTIINHTDTTITISAGTNSLIWQDGTTGAATGNRTISNRGVANIWRHSAGAFFVWGIGLA
jgi:hypothetical protein